MLCCKDYASSVLGTGYDNQNIYQVLKTINLKNIICEICEMYATNQRACEVSRQSRVKAKAEKMGGGK